MLHFTYTGLMHSHNKYSLLFKIVEDYSTYKWHYIYIAKDHAVPLKYCHLFKTNIQWELS